MDLYKLLVMGVLADTGFCLEREVICASPQHLELGKIGTINCTFQEDFFAVVWYNSTDLSKNDPLLHYQSSLILGPGYKSGEFDIFPNGSLIINNVSLQHDHSFRAVYMPSDEDVPRPIDVRIIVKIPANPVIDECNQHRTCIMEAKYEGNLTCRVKGIRPSVQLQWKAFGDINSEVISFTNEELIIEDKGEAYDITFKATYHITNASMTKITLECVDSEGLLNLKAQIELLISRTFSGETTTVTPTLSKVQSTGDHDVIRNTCVSTPKRNAWIVLAISMIFVILVGSLNYLCWKSRRLQEKLNKLTTVVYNLLHEDPHTVTNYNNHSNCLDHTEESSSLLQDATQQFW